MGLAPTSFVTPHVQFAFDIVCPFAFAASERIEDVAKFTGAKVEWVPVLLGGLYDLTKAPQGKAGSASDVPTPAAKKVMQSKDFQREFARYHLPLKFHPQHPVRSVDAQRLLCAFPSEHRPALAHALFHEYWYKEGNINLRTTLLRVARSLKLTSVASPAHNGPFSQTPQLNFALDESVFEDKKWADLLRSNTQDVFEKGGFGVPFFWVEERKKMFWGQDRMHLLEAELLSVKLSKPLVEIRSLERLHPRCLRTPPEDRKRLLTFWFDFSSPWAYLGWTQLERLQRDAGPGLKIQMKPFLLGALFREIGTPMLPGSVVIEIKRKYGAQDIEDWNQYWSAVNAQEYPPIEPVGLRYPDEFPIRSVNALRVALLEPKTIAPIYRAAWRDNKLISKPEVLAQVLTEAGFNGEKLLEEVTTGSKAESVKAQLKAHNDEAIKLGICGAPTYQVGNHLVWGQDRLNVVQDLVMGWRPETSKLKASVSSYPHYDYRL